MEFFQSTSNASQPSSSELSNSEFSSVEPGSEDPLVQLMKEVKEQPFTTNKSLEKSLELRHRAFQQNQPPDQYFVFSFVPPAQSSKLSDDRSEQASTVDSLLMQEREPWPRNLCQILHMNLQ